MATVSHVLRTSPYYLLFVLVLHVAYTVRGDSFSASDSVCVNNQCRFTVRVPAGSSWRLTPDFLPAGNNCEVFFNNYDIRELPRAQDTKVDLATIEVTVPQDSGRLYFCQYNAQQSPVEGKWIHEGSKLSISTEQKDRLQLGKSLPAERENLQNNQQTALDTQISQALNVDTNIEDNLINKDNWVDLSHDIDVNNEPGAARPTREEANDILVRSGDKDQYVPLSEANSHNVEDQANSYGTNDYVDEYIKLPEVDGNIRQIKELGSTFRDVEPLEQDNSIIDLIETGVVREKRDTVEETVIPTVDDGVTQETATETDKGEPKAELFKDDIGTGVVQAQGGTIKLEGIRIDESSKAPENEDGIPSVLALSPVTIRLFGIGFTEDTYISFTHEKAEWGEPCKYRLKGEHRVLASSVRDNTAQIKLLAPAPIVDKTFYFCTLNAPDGLGSDPRFIHQGSKSWVTLRTHNKPLPLWATLLLILVCLMFSALFSGLNLGLMSLDRTELKIIANTGSEEEKKYARAIQPVRDHGNYLLCSILLGNVAVNSTFTILLDDLMSGLFAVIFSTLAIVCLGEIVPQAICSRHGLMIGAKTIVVTKAVMGMTAPLAYPVSKLLDYLLGEEIGNVYNRERLKELVKVTNDINDLDKDEVNIISGALEMRKKTVSQVMTKIEDVYMLPLDIELNFENMSEIVTSGFSRIPVYENTRDNIVTVLFIKDLAFVDPDDNTPLKMLIQFYQNPCNFVFEDTTLDVMFRIFKEGQKGHMAFVQRVNNEGEGDPFYETIGLVTLEDVIEEMIQAEIVDETDVFTDNKSKRRRNPPQDKLQDFAAFLERRENQRVRISPQLTLATFQFLSSTIDAFRPDVISETVLRRLLRQDIIHQIKLKGKDKKHPSTLVYQQGKPVDYFVFILEGRVEVTVGRENLVFEAGPFTYFGVQALTQNVGVAESPAPSAMGSLQNINMDSKLHYTFVPDYSVRAVTELLYLVVKRSLYLAAKRATLLEKTSSVTKGGVSVGEQFDNEVDKLLQSMDEDDVRTPPKQVSPSQPPTSANSKTRSMFMTGSPGLAPSSPAVATDSAGAEAAPSEPDRSPRPADPPASGSPALGVPSPASGNGDVTYKFPPAQQIETDEK